MKRVRVLVADDSAVFRELLAPALAQDPEVEVVGLASNRVQALQLAARLRPDVVTLDLEMPCTARSGCRAGPNLPRQCAGGGSERALSSGSGPCGAGPAARRGGGCAIGAGWSASRVRKMCSSHVRT